MAEKKTLLQSAIDAHQGGGLSEGDREELIGRLRAAADKPGMTAGARSDHLHAADALAAGTKSHKLARRKVRANTTASKADADTTATKGKAPPKATPPDAKPKPTLLSKLKAKVTTSSMNIGELALVVAKDPRLDDNAILALLRKHGHVADGVTIGELPRLAIAAELAIKSEAGKLQQYAQKISTYGKRLPALLRQEDQTMIDQLNAGAPARQAQLHAHRTSTLNARQAQTAEAAKRAAEAEAGRRTAQTERDAESFEQLRDGIAGAGGGKP